VSDVRAGRKLGEELAKRLASGDEAPAARLEYARGHELSGTTSFTLAEDGRYELESNQTVGREPVRYEGVLDPEQRRSLFESVERNHVLAVPSSSRNIGDDEIPIDLTIEFGDTVHRLEIWDNDAAANTDFRRFERDLLALVGELSDGRILALAD
jgi:hypothetical protein